MQMDKNLDQCRVFVYGTLKPDQANFEKYCAGKVIAQQQAIAYGELFLLPMGYPAMIVGNSPVYGYLLSFKYDSILINIFTDGENNTSYSYKDRAAIALKSAKLLNILVTFVADSYVISKLTEALNISSDNTLVVENTAKGYEKGMLVNSVARSNYTTQVVEDNVNMDGYFKDFKE